MSETGELGGIFDTHAHYDDAAFDADRDALLSALPAQGVGTVLNCGTNPQSCEQSVALARRHPHVFAAVGIHPSDADSFGENVLAALLSDADRQKIVAVGEIGLDYHYPDTDRELQKKIFLRQLGLAREAGLPVIIHCRDAVGDTLDCLRQYEGTGVFHCFSETPEVARQLLKKDFYFGFGGVITFRNARKAVEAVQVIPTERLLLETDCPYMAPEPFRGTRNDSTRLKWVAQRLAELKGVSAEEMIRITRANAERLFKIHGNGVTVS